MPRAREPKLLVPITFRSFQSASYKRPPNVPLFSTALVFGGLINIECDIYVGL
jgi:hypothetical protein